MNFPDHIRRRMNNPEDYPPVGPMSKGELEVEIGYLRENRDYWHGSCLMTWEQRDFANLQLEQAEDNVRRLRSALQELRTRLHVAGRRPEECYEMSMIDDALNRG